MRFTVAHKHYTELHDVLLHLYRRPPITIISKLHMNVKRGKDLCNSFICVQLLLPLSLHTALFGVIVHCSRQRHQRKMPKFWTVNGPLFLPSSLCAACCLCFWRTVCWCPMLWPRWPSSSSASIYCLRWSTVQRKSWDWEPTTSCFSACPKWTWPVL